MIVMLEFYHNISWSFYSAKPGHYVRVCRISKFDWHIGIFQILLKIIFKISIKILTQSLFKAKGQLSSNKFYFDV